MPDNLLSSTWTQLDSAELRIVLDRRIGGPGQFSGRQKEPNKFHIPLAGETCRVVLTYSDGKISSIERGPAFDSHEWERLCVEIEHDILYGPIKVGRDFSFCSFRVKGSWRGRTTGIQILPPPGDAPRAPQEMADHPFILEFPVRVAALWPVTNHRRMRDHRRLTLVLNVLLAGRTSLQPRQQRSFWAAVPADNGELTIKWVNEFFFANFGHAILDELSPPNAEHLEEIDPEEYYTKVGHDGRGLRVPTNLDDSLSSYLHLSPENREKFDRASFWMDMASRLWDISMSASFAALVSAVEALTNRGDGLPHGFECPVCKQYCQHEVPGATERFRAFLEHHAAGVVLKPVRSKMYAVRSAILHGSALLQFDQDRVFGLDLPRWNERHLHDDLWRVARLALRHWLMQPDETLNYEGSDVESKARAFLGCLWSPGWRASQAPSVLEKFDALAQATDWSPPEGPSLV